MHRRVLAVLLMTTTGLAACSGSSGYDRGGNAPSERFLAKDAGTVTEALAAGETLRASGRASSQWVRNEDNTAVLAADSTVKIARNDAGGLDLIIGDRTVRFTSAMLTADGEGFELPDGSAGIYGWDGTMTASLNPLSGGYTRTFDYWVSVDEAHIDGIAMIGTETDPGDLAALPKATYAGEALVDVAPIKNFEDWDESVRTARGDVTLTADFGAGTVDGKIDALEGRATWNEDPTGTWTPFDGELTLGKTEISGNGFTGLVTADADFVENVGTLNGNSTYSGTFFGPEAEEVGGGLNLSGSNDDGDAFIGKGIWRGWQD